MRVPGPLLVLLGAVFVVGFVAAVWVAGNELRQEYRVATRGDRERFDLDLAGDRVVWLEDAQPGTSAMVYHVATRERATLEPANASRAHPVALDGERFAWVQGPAPHRVAVRVRNASVDGTVTFASANGSLELPGRTLEGDALLAYGERAGSTGLWEVDLRTDAFAPVKLLSAPSILTGDALEWEPARGPLLLAGGVVWWSEGSAIHRYDLAARRPLPSFLAGGRVLSLDADAGLVAWAEDRGLERRVVYRGLANGTQGEVSAFPGDQHSPAVNGTRVVFVQHDGLVRLKDLATGEERVLPARNQENIKPRLSPTHAAWLSGTIEGHHVLVVPLG